ncbi:MAG: hypothetical protein VX090_01320, partial [Pseudomonadota bacterium]|nr:hypothetical protein [Pseudomonadota bacterium]
MPAVGVAAELNFVNRKKFDLPIDRHRFDGAHKPFGVRWNYFFFAGYKRNGAGAFLRHDLVVIFARQ